MTYNLDGALTIEGETFGAGDRVIVTEWTDGPHSETHTFVGIVAGTVEATLGIMLVVTDHAAGEDVVLAASDLVAIDKISEADFAKYADQLADREPAADYTLATDAGVVIAAVRHVTA
jgi:hypothetical protein